MTISLIDDFFMTLAPNIIFYNYAIKMVENKKAPDVSA